MTNWPNTIPPDLARMLRHPLGMRSRPSPQDVWGAVQEWLRAHEVPVPETLPTEAARDHHQRG